LSAVVGGSRRVDRVVSSVHALVGIPGHPAYAAAKGALVSLAGQLAVEYAPDVRVNSGCQGRF